MLNPSQIMFREYMSDIVLTRQKVGERVSNAAPLVSSGVNNLINSRLVKSKSPALGEMIPWLLCEMFQLNKPDVQDIATAWLEIYLYTSFIDDVLDSQRAIVPNEMLAASYIFQDGIAVLSKIVDGTKYEETFKQSIEQSAENELLDIREGHSLLADKATIAEGKNLILLSCATALAASHSLSGDKIVEFTKSILLGLQYLDDVADIEEDYLSKNYSKLLTAALNRSDGIHLINEGGGLAREEILKLLITTDSLSDLLMDTKDILSAGILVAVPKSKDNKDRICVFLSNIVILINDVLIDIDCAKKALRLPGAESSIAIGKVDRSIRRIAQSS